MGLSCTSVTQGTFWTGMIKWEGCTLIIEWNISLYQKRIGLLDVKALQNCFSVCRASSCLCYVPHFGNINYGQFIRIG